MAIESDVYLCGWRVQSEIPLPELLPWSPQENSPADIQIRIGAVEPVIISPTSRRLQIGDSGACRLEVPGICRFSVSNGSRIVVDPQVPLTTLDSSDSPGAIALRNYLFGTGLAMLCHQRGVFPLHGSALSFGNRAVIFSANSGAGKSTLAAALAGRGHVLLADDVCALDETPTGWAVRPAFPRVKLRPNSLQAIFGEQTEPPPLSLQGKHHFRFKPVHSFQPQPVPVDVIYFLDQTVGDEPDSIIEVKGVDRIALLRSQTFRRKLGIRLGRQEFLNRTLMRLATTIKVCRLRRAFDFSRMDSTIALLESIHGAPLQNSAPPA